MSSPTVTEQIATASEAYAASLDPSRKGLKNPPSRKALVLTCMDARLNPLASLGLKEGEANVVRNAGGRALDALRNILVSQQVLDTNEIVVIHHTDCGMLTFTDEQVRNKLKSNPPKKSVSASDAAIDAIVLLPFSDVEKSLRDDLQFLKEHPLVKEDTLISGWIHETKDGRMTRIA